MRRAARRQNPAEMSRGSKRRLYLNSIMAGNISFMLNRPEISLMAPRLYRAAGIGVVSKRRAACGPTPRPAISSRKLLHHGRRNNVLIAEASKL